LIHELWMLTGSLTISVRRLCAELVRLHRLRRHIVRLYRLLDLTADMRRYRRHHFWRGVGVAGRLDTPWTVSAKIHVSQ
jgi:hypothetical protein